MTKIKFPSWDEFNTINESYVNNKAYKGYVFEKCLTDNLYVSIEARNESFIFPTDPNVIRFALCTKNGFAISSICYENSEAGYLLGCTHLIDSANKIAKSLEELIQANLQTLRRNIDKYNKEHPDLDEEGETIDDETNNIPGTGR